MKTGFKKSLAALMAMLMIFSIVSVTASAATIYTITFKPGEYAKETTEDTMTAEKGVKVTLPGVMYTRTGYTQTGWSTNVRGTSRTYALERYGTISKNMTLYPYWTANKYDVTFSGGEFGTGTPKTVQVTFDKTTTAPDALFTRDGYIQTGWTATVIQITEDENGNEVLTPVEDTIGLKEKTAVVTGDVTYVPVWTQVIIDSSAEIVGENFGSECIGYSAPEAGQVSITNEGNTVLNFTLPTNANYNIQLKSGKLALQPGATLVIAIQPKTGLAAGTYDEAIAITCDAVSQEVIFNAKFTVTNHSFDIYESDGNASYTQDGTKTAECSNGCGLTDTIVDIGSMKVFSADNNTVIGLLPQYIYHKTVRFTAFGSGMDNEEAVEGSKRYLPISWYVNDTHNGEFDESVGFEVNYVHTDFGKFVLTITYIEQEMDANGEWVDTGVTDTKEFNYSIGASEKDEQEIVRPNTIVNIIFGLFGYFFELIGGLFS